jgi:hypothetical protein
MLNEYTDDQIVGLVMALDEEEKSVTKGNLSYDHFNEVYGFFSTLPYFSRVRELLSIKKQPISDDVWWSIPLYEMMYEVNLEDLPVYINTPVYGAIARWRLKEGV